jgi:hypothetical protein
LTLGLAHFSLYYLGDGYWINLDQSTPTYTEDQLQNIARQIMSDPNAPEFEARLTELFVVYYNQVIIPALEAIQGGCTPLQQLTPKIYGWDRQAQLLFGANNNPFQPAFDEINQKVGTAMVNCWNQTISPCVDWTNTLKAQQVIAMARQAELEGLGSQINLSQVHPCNCSNLALSTKGWTGTLTYNWNDSGQATFPSTGATETSSIQAAYNVTLRLDSPHSGSTYPYTSDPAVQNWQGDVQAFSGSGTIADTTTYKDQYSTTTTATNGSGPIVGNSFARVVLSPTSCLYAIVAEVDITATTKISPGGSTFTGTYRVASIFVPDVAIQTNTQPITLSGSAQILLPLLQYNGGGDGPHASYAFPGGDGTALDNLEYITEFNHTPNWGSASVSWNLTPIP